ncbi:MAG: matrixin family metalloprotease [archaeon GB-1867-035]|nr:matrixin family metalloprotease [Candidatus Culexmicrobium profundum]
MSVESHWINTTESHMIYSFAEIDVEKYLKGLFQKNQTITIVYEGGTVNDFTIRVFINPWGEIICYPGQIIKAYCKIDKNFGSILKAIYVEEIKSFEKEKNLGTLSSSEFIYEEQGCNFEYDGIKWSSSDLPVEYYVNPNTADCTGEEDAVKAAFQTWEDEYYSLIDYTYKGTININAPSNDGYNVVFWRGNGFLPSSVLASTYFYLSNSRLVGFDICFNDDYTWSIGSQSGKFDVQNVATHEAGHTLLLRDLYDTSNSEQTMYGYASAGETKKRSLADGDKRGVQYIYPRWSKPSVTITEPSDLEQVQGLITIYATISSSYDIIEVKFKVADYNDFTYDSGWQTMSKSGGYYIGYWNSYDVYDGWYYITVRAKTSKGIYGYDWIRIKVMND